MALKNLLPDADIVESYLQGPDRSFAKRFLNSGVLTQDEVIHLGQHPGALSHLAEFGTLNNWNKPELKGWTPKAVKNIVGSESGSIAQILKRIPQIAEFL